MPVTRKIAERAHSPALKVYSTAPGAPLPQGAHVVAEGVNFSVFSRHATRVSLLVFEAIEAEHPCQVIELDRKMNKTGDIWHIRLLGAGQGLIYAFRVDGPHAPERGHRFDAGKILIDPFATAVVGPRVIDFGRICEPETEARPSENGGSPAILKCLVTQSSFDWGQDRPLHHSWSDLVIYEAHVRGLTAGVTADCRAPGTFLGVIDKIPYLKALGVNALELMPLQEFNPDELTARNPETQKLLRNYWGYNTIAFFAPYEGYGTRSYPGCQVDEFKSMVKALHEAGIEVLLDVVFNHTAEGDATGPTLSFRGLDNAIYYLLEEDRRHYKNYSGCGNTMNCSHPVVRNFILDCLRYWVVEMHVDGFRFDLASILGRDQQGHLVPDPPLLEQIAEDPILRDVKLIAEAWDAGGAYLVGRFPGERWSEWNGVYRDDVRRFWRGDAGMAGALASRLCGSADIYEHNGKAPLHSINFVTCHDGFTLHDLVSYDTKHNQANGEDNRDGCNANYSFNHGQEGPTEDPFILNQRQRQVRNMLVTLFFSRGVPMMLGGDEFGRSQHGNNNAYCQDGPLSWFDWGLAERNAPLVRFVRELIALRRRFRVLSAARFYRPDEISWLSPEGAPPSWETERSIACLIQAHEGGQKLYLAMNPTDEAVLFRAPPSPPGRHWRRLIDTAMASPDDIVRPEEAVAVLAEAGMQVSARSALVLLAGGPLEQRSKT